MFKSNFRANYISFRKNLADIQYTVFFENKRGGAFVFCINFTNSLRKIHTATDFFNGPSTLLFAVRNFFRYYRNFLPALPFLSQPSW